MPKHVLTRTGNSPLKFEGEVFTESRQQPTIAKPEKMAPATKYGGKIVVCQPGTTDVAKSNDTIV